MTESITNRGKRQLIFLTLFQKLNHIFGYIQDKNGTPCCENDYVRFKVKEDCKITKYAGLYLVGYLVWNVSLSRFYIITKHIDFEMTDILKS